MSGASFRARLRGGERLVGTIMSLDSPEVAEILAGAGFDWLFLDAEHAPYSPLALQRIIIAAGPLPCLVRLPNHDEIWIKRALDIGAAGIIVPQVNDAAQARTIVQRAKYSPEGARGVGLARAHGYGYDAQSYLARANEDTAVIVQAEHIDAVRNAAEIAAVPGVDALFLGPYDLSASMGKPGRIDDADVQGAIAQVAAAARAANRALGFFAMNVDDVARRLAQGFNLVACSVDVALLGARAAEVCAALKGAPA